MVRKNRPRSSGLFLMELILAILFFSIASAVCVQIFVKSHLLSVESRALNQAVNKCTSAAEYISAVSDGELEMGTETIYYDEDFIECGREEALYMMNVDTEEDGRMVNAHIEIRQADKADGKVIYELDVVDYIARRTGHEER
ncbi:hypothetical protein [Mediterraneibacter agrestimuris]|uniref:hypothetical protein n=1 Tax=Mediterraneibacter agrestimuris TaxID=2941333 RepID=UPI00203FB6F5|nr:hypothetical protein [Mediterraneibacter agrestimuris]